MKVELLASAKKDLVEGFDFYERQQSGLGANFLESLFGDIDTLAHHAGIHRRIHGAHRLLSTRFPYAIYYNVEDNTAKVKAVLDCRRDPQHIQRELGKA